MIDSHAHITSSSVYSEVDALLERAKEAGLVKIVNICTDPLTLERGLELASRYKWVYNVAATTPHDVEVEGEAYFDIMAQHARSGKLVAVGETGLDYHYEHSNRDIQKLFLRRYLELAKECQLPVVIHCREAFADLFAILDDFKGLPGVLHCFTGTLDEARAVIERDWYLSLSGIVTFKKSEELKKVAREMPLDKILIETDSPYLAPQSRRGKQNEPAFLAETAACIASERGIDTEKLIQATAKNACTLFKKMVE